MSPETPPPRTMASCNGPSGRSEDGISSVPSRSRWAMPYDSSISSPSNRRGAGPPGAAGPPPPCWPARSRVSEKRDTSPAASVAFRPPSTNRRRVREAAPGPSFRFMSRPSLSLLELHLGDLLRLRGRLEVLALLEADNPREEGGGITPYRRVEQADRVVVAHPLRGDAV